jgi:hypothetical protein
MGSSTMSVPIGFIDLSAVPQSCENWSFLGAKRARFARMTSIPIDLRRFGIVSRHVVHGLRYMASPQSSPTHPDQTL